MRDVLVGYLRERQASVDFSSLQRFAYLLGKLFWADLETHHPGIGSLKLPRDVAAAWKQRARRRDLSFDEHRGFWTWAMVEVLRHTGSASKN